jgi:outer membrane protein OmpA-like peptidoglycan-associated protein
MAMGAVASPEYEADRVAAQVMRAPAPHGGGGWLARRSAGHGVERGGAGHIEAPPGLSEGLRSPGVPLDSASRTFFEPRLGHDLGKVRIHANPQAAASAAAIGARAYTVGRNIVFGERQHAPATHAGKRLLAHELTHVLQQRAGGVAVQRAEVDDNPDFCFPQDGSPPLQDVAGVVNDWIAQAQAKARNEAPDVPTAIYDELGVGFKTVVEKRILALPEGQVRHVSYGESRYRLNPVRVTGWPMAPVVNLCGVCVGADKLGHFFQQGSEYFRIGGALRDRIQTWTQDERQAFAEAAGIDAPAFSPVVEEDLLIDTYTHEYGKYLEGFPHRLPDEEIAWLSDVIEQYRFFGYYGKWAGGVMSRGDLEANKQGGVFYRDAMRAPDMRLDISHYVNDDWNEYANPNSFGGLGLQRYAGGPRLPDELWEPDLPVPGPEWVDRERYVEEIRFETDSTEPDVTQMQAFVESLALFDYSLRSGRYHVAIKGHASRLGTADANLQLSEQRAEAVDRELQRLIGLALEDRSFALDPKRERTGEGERRAEERGRPDGDDSALDRVVRVSMIFW